MRIDSSGRFAEGDFLYTRCFTRDVTGVAALEEELRESEARLRLAQDAARLGSWEWEIATARVQWSDTLQELHGLPPGSFEGTFEAFARDIHPEDLPVVQAAIERALATGLHEVEYRIVVRGGEVRWVSARGRVIYGAGGKPERVVGICMDSTARKRAEIALQLLADAAEHLGASLDYRLTFQRITDVLVPRLADWCIVDVAGDGAGLERVAVAHRDPARAALARRLQETAPEDRLLPISVLDRGEVVLVPKFDAGLLPGLSHNPHHARLLEEMGMASFIITPLIARGRLLGALTLVRGPGSPPYEEADLEVVRHLARRSALSLDNARLYRESERVREQLEAANRVKDEFLDSVSHEMRTPLTIIHAGLNLLRRRQHELGPEEFGRLLRDLEEESGQLHGMVENLLALARSEAAETVELEPVRVDRLVARLTTDFAERHSSRQFELQAADLPLVASHAPSLERVVRNLLSNAAKYSPPGSTVRVSAAVDDSGHVVVTVEDQGPGVPEEELERIFERFYRSSSNSAKAAGTGIGLALCRRLADMMGARVWAEPRLGGGLSLSLSLPVYTFSETATAEPVLG